MGRWLGLSLPRDLRRMLLASVDRVSRFSIRSTSTVTELPNDFMIDCATHGYLGLLQWVCATKGASGNRAHWDWQICAYAASNGHLDHIQPGALDSWSHPT